MSVVALARYEILFGNDPNVVKSFEDPNHSTSEPKKTVFQGVADPILGFGRILFNSSTDPTSAIGGDVMPTANECAMYWCVQTLNTSIQNGVLTQTVVRSWSNSSALDTSDVHLSPYETDSNTVAKRATDTYYVSPMSNVPLVRFLQDAFNATVNAVNLPGAGFTEQELLDLSLYSSDISQALWYANDLSALMANLADRMTDALRNLYSDPVAAADNRGQVYTTRTYVHVTWPWIILPVGLVVASCGVLIAAIVSSSRHDTVVWKSSSLAVLFHGFVGGSGESVYNKQMEKRAEEMKVRLKETADGDLRLVEVKRGSGGVERK